MFWYAVPTSVLIKHKEINKSLYLTNVRYFIDSLKMYNISYNIISNSYLTS